MLLISIGENRIDAMMNLNVASKTGDNVSSTMDAATKLRPHTVATKTDARVAYLISRVSNKHLLYVHIYIDFLIRSKHMFNKLC